MEKIEFSFAEGGALLTQFRKLRVFTCHHPSLPHRILLAVSITWMPILIFTASHGLAWGGKVQVPFLFDLIQHARFLVALPIALWAEKYISPRFESVLNRFLKAEVISGEELPRFKEAVSHARTFMNSLLAEILILALAYLYLSLGLHRNLSPGLVSWDHLGPVVSTRTTLAVQWYLWVSMPYFLFVWFRWVWRQLIWSLLLFRISRLRLRLISTHPDRAGGLAFVSVAQRRFAALIFAISAIASASIAEEILFQGASLQSFQLELLAFFLICVLIVLGPLLVFSPPMVRAKLRDWGNYGILATSYTLQFDEKWIRGNHPLHNQLLGNSDIQSLSDLRNSYEGISQMRTFLPDRQTILILLAAYLVPLSPLLATVIPLNQVLSELFTLLSK